MNVDAAAYHMTITQVRKKQLEDLRREARILRALIELAKQYKQDQRASKTVSS